MKKLLFLCSFLMVAGLATGQTCTKSKKACSAKKAATSAAVETPADDATRVASAMTEADVAADADELISKKVCSVSGSTSYYKECVCPESGKVSLKEVIYDGEAKTFVAAAEAEADVIQVTDEAADTKAAEGTAKKQCAKSCAKTCSKGKSKTE